MAAEGIMIWLAAMLWCATGFLAGVWATLRRLGE